MSIENERSSSTKALLKASHDTALKPIPFCRENPQGKIVLVHHRFGPCTPYSIFLDEPLNEANEYARSGKIPPFANPVKLTLELRRDIEVDEYEIACQKDSEWDGADLQYL